MGIIIRNSRRNSSIPTQSTSPSNQTTAQSTPHNSTSPNRSRFITLNSLTECASTAQTSISSTRLTCRMNIGVMLTNSSRQTLSKPLTDGFVSSLSHRPMTINLCVTSRLTRTSIRITRLISCHTTRQRRRHRLCTTLHLTSTVT